MPVGCRTVNQPHLSGCLGASRRYAFIQSVAAIRALPHRNDRAVMRSFSRIVEDGFVLGEHLSLLLMIGVRSARA